MRRRLLWQIIPGLAVALLALLLLLGWFARNRYADHTQQRVRDDLRARARLATLSLAPGGTLLPGGELARRCEALAEAAQARVTLTARDGTALCDSAIAAPTLENQRRRPEVAAALDGGVGEAVRRNVILGDTFRHVAVPLYRNGAVAGVLRVSRPLTPELGGLAAIHTRLGALALLGAALVLVIAAMLLWRFVLQPLAALRHMASHYARGEQQAPADTPDSEEFRAVVREMNHMAGRFDEQVRQARAGRAELETVLSSMREALLAVDRDNRVLNLNPAAARMFGVQPQQARGRGLQEVVRNADLLRFAVAVLESRVPLEKDIELFDAQQRVLQARGNELTDAAGRGIGALIVLNDVTRLYRLENMRREFVANVSHELRTPITAIRGFVETLQDGALEDKSSAERFMGIIASQVERLSNIIEDLLTLSRLEREDAAQELEVGRERVRSVLETAVHSCLPQAEAKRIRIDVDCPPEQEVMANRALLEQALVNLLENAVKYSHADTAVTVAARAEGNRLRVRVSDEGPGIATQHLPRLFERFYRVDRARSRRLGGTGLGLAIVKHVAQLHGGRVMVESAPGRGSTFTVELPLNG